ncbi:hypothetical protein [Lacticaseibacillus daqingensis]|uniref:hypothetical protein n=1 Tax=Lacticaseibacillus daqingensis TaxID=2486014 RepID=UPI001CDCF2C1|nr:hypothetical protein [Lacticaseibacillus daqingensis]
MKQIGKLTLALGSLLMLAGCGQSLTTGKTTYKQTGMVAVIKGTAKGTQQVRYQAPAATGTVKVSGDSFVVSVPVAPKAQTVTLKAGDLTHRVTVQAAKSLGTYSAVAKAYNQAVVAMALPAETQAQLKQAQSVDISKLSPAEKLAAAQQQQALAAAMATAQKQTKVQQLPASVTGLKQVLKSAAGTVRLNVQAGQLMGITEIVPIKAMKTKKLQAQFATQFGLLANAVGADAKKVGTAFQKATSDKDSSSTTIDTITSHGVKFDVGFSTTALYIYITK